MQGVVYEVEAGGAGAPASRGRSFGQFRLSLNLLEQSRAEGDLGDKNLSRDLCSFGVGLDALPANRFVVPHGDQKLTLYRRRSAISLGR